MNGGLAREIAHCCVANLGNSPAITCDLCLAFGDFESHIHSTRLNQRFLKGDLPRHAAAGICAASPGLLQPQSADRVFHAGGRQVSRHSEGGKESQGSWQWTAAAFRSGADTLLRTWRAVQGLPTLRRLLQLTLVQRPSPGGRP